MHHQGRLPLFCLAIAACEPASPGVGDTSGTSEPGTTGAVTGTTSTGASTADAPTGPASLTDVVDTTSADSEPTTSNVDPTTGDVTSESGETDTTGDSDTGAPDCAIVESLIVDDFTDLAALGCIEEVIGSAKIGPTTQLTSLAPLKNLRKVGVALEIRGNDKLVDLTGLDALEQVGHSLMVHNNPALVTMDGLDTVTSLGRLWVEDNPSLAALSTFSGVVALEGGEVILSRLPQLQSLDDLAGITFVPKFGMSVTLDRLDGLIDLEGLAGCCAVENVALRLTNNPLLKNLKGLDQFVAFDELIIGANHGMGNLAGMQNVEKIGRLEIGSECGFGDGESDAEGNNSLVSLVGTDSLEVVSGSLLVAGNPKIKVAVVEEWIADLTVAPDPANVTICENLDGEQCFPDPPCPQ